VHQVARLGPLTQLALARLLQRRGEEAGEADLRVVATTSVDLAPRVQAGRFREDLLYRINVLTLRVPALTERREDLDAIARGLLERVGGGGTSLAPGALDPLRERSWAGGMHQLRLTLELASRRSPSGVLEGEGVAAAVGAQESGGGGGADPEGLGGPGALLRLPDRSLRSAEEALIRQVLAETGGNKLRSAEILGIHRTTLYHKLRDFGIEA
jgi:DNA-binding NtrC family response regulator